MLSTVIDRLAKTYIGKQSTIALKDDHVKSDLSEKDSLKVTEPGGLCPDVVPSRPPPQSGAKTVYTLEEVSDHCAPESCWVVLWDHVYDVTKFVREHPGGEEIIYEHGGHDATFAFRDVGHSNDALLMVMPYRIGILVEEERIFKRQKMDSCST